MGRLGADAEAKLVRLLNRARAYTLAVGAHREEDGGEPGDTGAAELAAWEEVWRFVTDDAFNDQVAAGIFGTVPGGGPGVGGQGQ